tara:strand:- start:128617 stop:129075 length:459 start_codon:yes stop_codon:yes gene_type:complete
MRDFLIRKGEEGDMASLMELIHELAVYEKAPEMVVNTQEKLLEDWKLHKAFDFIVAEMNGDVKGISLYYPRYSTWRGRCFYLEDLYVRPENRGQGLGLALLEETAKIAKSQGAIRLDWQVLDWNSPAVEFYENQGAMIEKEWWNCKMTLEKF